MAVSVVGFDIGTLTSYVAVARQGGIETVANEYSDRNTPTFISFTDKMRMVGHEAKQQQVTNIQNTLYNFTKFIGKEYNDTRVQNEMKKVPYKIIPTFDNRVAFEVEYLGEPYSFTPEQALAMHLTKMKEVAEINLNTKVVDVVINIPTHSTDSERRAILDSAQIANLNCVKIINDTTASALAYGIYCQDLPDVEAKPKHVVFIDMGYSNLQSNIVAFNKGKMKVISSSSAFVGGRDFDGVIYDEMKKIVKERYHLDVIDGKKPAIRLLQECEKLKKLMSANATDIPLNIECFMNDIDIHATMKRSEFENLSENLLSSVQSTLKKLLSSSKLTLDEIESVEIVGGSTRIPAVKQIIFDLFKKEPRTSLNADEAVARGCALQCAIISPAFRVREFSITDVCIYSLSLMYEDKDGLETVEVYPKWHSFPASKQMTFNRLADFRLEAKYSDSEEIPMDNRFIGTFQISGVKPGNNGEPAKVKVKLRVNPNGIFTVSQAQLVEIVEKQVEVEVDADSEETKKESNESMETDTNGSVLNDGAKDHVVNNEGEQKSVGNENGIDSQPKKIKKMVTKNVTKHTDLPLNAMILQYTQQKICEFSEKENQMIMQVKLEREKAAAKNSVEEYVYDMRNKISCDFESFASEQEKELFSAELTSTEDWLYDEGEDVSKQVYLEKLSHLKQFGDVIVNRAKEASERPHAMEAFNTLAMNIQKVITAIDAKDSLYEHLDSNDREALVHALSEKQTWFTQEINRQRDRKSFEDPSILSSQIFAQKQSLEAVCNPIINKPKPIVTPEQPPKAESSENWQSNGSDPTNVQSQDKSEGKPEDMDLD